MIPRTKYECQVQMSSKEYKNVLCDLQLIAQSVRISCSTNNLKFSITSEEQHGDVTYKHRDHIQANSNFVQIKYQQQTDANKISKHLAIRYLTSFTKATILSEFVTLCMATNMPFLTQYTFSSGYLRYYLAPKIED